jgi:hypothetical protein
MTRIRAGAQVPALENGGEYDDAHKRPGTNRLGRAVD